MSITRRNILTGTAMAALGAFGAASSAYAESAEVLEFPAEAVEFLGRPYITTPEEAADKAAIYELLSFERFARDNALWEPMKQCYAEDSVVTISWYKGDGAGFVDASAAQGSYAPHKIYNYVTWINGDKAVTFMMARCEMRAPIDGVLCEVGFDTELIFRTTKIDGQWYISYFDSIYNKDNLYPVLPTNQLDADLSMIEGMRTSYSSLAYYLGSLGAGVDQELLGRDRPEELQAFYAELADWLYA